MKLFLSICLFQQWIIIFRYKKVIFLQPELVGIWLIFTKKVPYYELSLIYYDMCDMSYAIQLLRKALSFGPNEEYQK